MEALQTKQYHLKWEKCADLPKRLYEASVAVDGDNVYVTAGTASKDETYNNVYCYDVTTDQWDTLPPSGHRCGVLCMMDSNLSVIGGQDPAAEKAGLDKISTYNRNTDNWANCYPDMRQKRFRPGVVTHGGHVIVMGGACNPDRFLDSIEIMNWRQRSPWREVSTKLPVPMWAIKPTIAGEHLLLVGHAVANGDRYNTSYQLSVATLTSSSLSDQLANQWEELLPAQHWDTTTVSYSNPPLIIGGRNDKGVPTSNISLYDTSKTSWIQVDSLTTARDCVGVATINSNTIIVIGGTSGGVNIKGAMTSSLPTAEIGRIVRNQ